MREGYIGSFCLIFSVAYLMYVFRCLRIGEIKHHGYTYSRKDSKCVFYTMLVFMGILGFFLFSIGAVTTVNVIIGGRSLVRDQTEQL